jgi:hypothetical protein
MAVQTPTTGAVFIDEVWAKDIQENRRNKLIATKIVDHQFEDRILNHGDTVHITSIAPLTATAITPGSPIVPIANTETEQTLVIDQYYGVGVELQDMLKKQSTYNLRKPYVDEMSYALASKIDETLLAEWTNVATANKMTAVAALTFAGIVDANVLLDKANVPMSDRALIVNAAGLGDLRKLAEFTMYEKTGKEGLVTGDFGLVGRIYGAPVYMTNAIPKAGGSAKNMLVHKSAFAVAIQMKPDMEYDRDILKKTDIITGSALWGVKTIRPDHAVVLQRTEA